MGGHAGTVVGQGICLAKERIRLVACLLLVLLCVLVRPVPAQEGDTVVFMHYWTGDLSGGIEEMATAFNMGNPDVRLKATGFEHESFKVGIRVMLDSGRPPDMFSYWAGARVQDLVDKGQLTPIDSVWEDADMDNRLTVAVARGCTYGESKYVLPVTQHYVAFFYNKDLFEKASVTPPKTWEQFHEACAALKESGVTPIALGSRDKWPAQFWFDYLLLRTAGPEYRDRLMRGLASYRDPEVEWAFVLWKELLDQGWFLEHSEAFGWAEAAKAVRMGKAAMTLMGTWAIGLFDGKLGWKQGEEYGFFPFPVVDPAIPDTALGPIDGIVVAAEGNRALALRALRLFSDPGPQKEMSLGSGALAPVTDVPIEVYGPIQQRILVQIRQSPFWAFNYDLATPPPVAEKGLDGLALFLDTPERLDDILSELQAITWDYFSKP